MYLSNYFFNKAVILVQYIGIQRLLLIKKANLTAYF